MGFFSTVFGLFGFGIGIVFGLVCGYFIFIYWQSTEVKEPIIKPLGELDSESIQKLLPEIPLWVKNPDYDRVDWLNRFVGELWPYLNKAICKIIKETTKPMIDEYSAKYKIDSVEFECLTLGNLPPTLHGIKAYDTQESEIILEPVLKWAGNPNILVRVKAYGIQATVQLVDLQVSAIARVTLKPLVPIFPCFSKIVVSLMEKPHVDFGLKLVGGDLMAIPGLYGFVQDIIKDQVANLYLWPKYLEVPILDDSRMAIKKPVGMLKVTIVNCKNLRKADLMGKSDPYVKMSLGEGTLSKKTQKKMSTLNPEWNETHSLLVQDPSSQALELQVYDWEKVSSHDLLGVQMIQLSSLTPDDWQTHTLNLRKNMDDNDPSNQKPRGQITLNTLYTPFKDEEVIPEEEENEAEDLEGKHHCNPYVKILYKGHEYKTKAIKKNRDPKWTDGRFEIMCPEAPENDRIKIEVWSKGSSMGLHRHEPLGYVDISLADVVSNKRLNQEYQLIDSRNGKVLVELQWLSG
ncbi:hypothetical protein KP509_07G078600 [Ceratopteris richardii]|uniref:Uncharacterized protein n=1 Tax=Ceratopteris richardii TaxID=49495 RepID=A0A8T2UJH0_CERRI|nr:hypothetical protein KP509_07G078600 [Ceratopteris richardii]